MTLGRPRVLRRLVLVVAHVAAEALGAQAPDSGTVLVTVRESMGMVAGFVVRSAGRTATTDADGQARLVLPAGKRTIAVTRIG